MRKISYIAGAVIALTGLGIYASNAQNNTNPNNSGVLVIEEDATYIPDRQNNSQRMNNSAANNNSENPRNPQNNGLTTGNNTPSMNNPNNMNNPSLNNSTNGGFAPLPGNQGVEVAPDNQPTVDKAMKNQNPSYNNGNPNVGSMYEQEVIETTN